jgi:hypothetical protein
MAGIGIVGGSSGAVADVSTNHKAVRSEIRPLDHGSLGVYRVSVVTGVMAAGLAAGSEILQFRWADASRLCVVERVAFDGMGSIAAFAAGVAQFRMSVARSWSASGTGGGATVFTTNNQKLRTSHATSLLNSSGEIRTATTTALGVGTKTLDSGAVGQAIGGLPATAGAGLPSQSMMDLMSQGHPLVLAQNEGFVITATVPATGTWTGGFTIHWTEMAAY